jgi:hypothetical protein
MMFLLAGLLGLQLFRGMPLQALSVRLGLVVLILGAAAVGTVLVSGSSVTMFGRAAGVLAAALATASAVGSFLTAYRSSKPDAGETPSTSPH